MISITLLAHWFILLPRLFCCFFLVYFCFSYCIHLLSLVVLYTANSLLETSCNFSLYASILFLNFVFIFTIITLNSFYDKLVISASLSCSSGFYLVSSSGKCCFSIPLKNYNHAVWRTESSNRSEPILGPADLWPLGDERGVYWWDT